MLIMIQTISHHCSVWTKGSHPFTWERGRLEKYRCDDDDTAAGVDGGNGEKGWQEKKCEVEAIFQSNRITMLRLLQSRTLALAELLLIVIQFAALALSIPVANQSHILKSSGV